VSEDDPLTSVRPCVASGRGYGACGGCVARGQWLADWAWVRRSVHGGDGGEVQGLHQAGGDGRYIVCVAGNQESDVGLVPKQMVSGPSTRPAVTVGTSSARRQVSEVGHMWSLGRGMTCSRGIEAQARSLQGHTPIAGWPDGSSTASTGSSSGRGVERAPTMAAATPSCRCCCSTHAGSLLSSPKVISCSNRQVHGRQVGLRVDV